MAAPGGARILFVTIPAGLVMLVAAGYLLVNWPWWSESRELDRIFAGSNVHLSQQRTRGGVISCLDACPDLLAGVSSRPNTFQGLTSGLTKALAANGYVMDNRFVEIDAGGAKISDIFDCRPPGNAFGWSTTDWVCEYAAKGPKFNVYGRLYFSGSAGAAGKSGPYGETSALAPESQMSAAESNITIQANR